MNLLNYCWRIFQLCPIRYSIFPMFMGLDKTLMEKQVLFLSLLNKMMNNAEPIVFGDGKQTERLYLCSRCC